MEKEDAMQKECPYLDDGKIIKFCKASDNLLMPGAERYKSYCTSEDYFRCPVHHGYSLRAKKSVATQRLMSASGK